MFVKFSAPFYSLGIDITERSDKQDTVIQFQIIICKLNESERWNDVHFLQQPAQRWCQRPYRWGAERSSPRWSWSWPSPPASRPGGPLGRSSCPAAPLISPGFEDIVSAKSSLAAHTWFITLIGMTNAYLENSDWAIMMERSQVSPLFQLESVLSSSSEYLALRPMSWTRAAFFAAHWEPTLAHDHLKTQTQWFPQN